MKKIIIFFTIMSIFYIFFLSYSNISRQQSKEHKNESKCNCCNDLEAEIIRLENENRKYRCEIGDWMQKYYKAEEKSLTIISDLSKRIADLMTKMFQWFDKYSNSK